MWDYFYKTAWSFKHRSAYQYSPLHSAKMEKPRQRGFKGLVQKLVSIL